MAAHHHEPQIADLFWYFVNFSVYVVAAYFMVRKQIAVAWGARAEKIEGQVHRGKHEMAAAEAELAQAAERLKRLPAELSDLERKIKAETQAESEAIVAQANERVAVMKRMADQTGAAETSAAKEALRRELADLVMRRAEEKIRKEYSAEKDRQVRASAVQGISALLQ